MKNKEWKVMSPNAVELVVTKKEWVMLGELRSKESAEVAAVAIQEHMSVLKELIETADEFEKPALEAELASGLKVYKLWVREYIPVESTFMSAAKGTGRVICAVGKAAWNQAKAAKAKVGEEESAFRTSATMGAPTVGEFPRVKSPVMEPMIDDPSSPFGKKID